MDWGLGRPSYGFLGPRLMFPNKFYYYGVMALDLGEWILVDLPLWGLYNAQQISGFLR